MRKIYFLISFVLLSVFFAAFSLHAQQVFKTTSSTVIGYLEYVPDNYAAASDKQPVVIFLHGIGERGANSSDPAVLETTIQSVAKLGPPAYVKNGHDFPFILISPQLKNNYNTWPVWYVMEIINHVKSYLRVDEKRIYLTGLSLGGGGTWTMAQNYAALFAAIAPVCGGYNSPSAACNIAAENLPVWAFHGDKDTVVPLSRSVNMVNAINACSPKPSPLAMMTIYPGVGHDAWRYSYRIDNSLHDPNVYQWMLSFTNRINRGNLIPTASAGADKNISGTSCSLSGAGSDADGSIVSYAWKQLSGPAPATLDNASSPSMTAAALIPGEYTFRLSVKDNSGNTDSDYVKVTVASALVNEAPVVTAGNNRTIHIPTNYVSLSGSATDADGTISRYEWTKVSGSTATLAGTTTKTLKAYELQVGEYVFRLTATDNDGASKYDDVMVTVRPNTYPVADAGADRVITLPVNSASITGTASDADGSIASYAWSKISGGTATLSGTTTATLVAGALAEGIYVFRFTVTDNRGAKTSDDVTVTVLGTNVYPVANAGADIAIVLPANSVSITGTSSDADGKIIAYAWSKVSGGSATLQGTTTASLTASGLLEGTYVFRFTVTDDDGAKKYDDVTVTVLKAQTENIAPVANAGPNQTLISPASALTVYGAGTDADGVIVSYAWRKTKGGTATLSGATTPTLKLTNLEPGSYYFRLTVTDDKGAVHYDDMLVSVKDGTASIERSVPGSHAILGDLTRRDLKDSTVIIYNDAGRRIYAGRWSLGKYAEVFSQQGLYIYQVVREGERQKTGKIYIQG